MNGDKVRFCRDNQSVSLHPHGLNSSAVAPAAPKMSRLVLASLVFMVMIIATSLMALFVVVLQKPRPAPEAYAYSRGFLGDNSTWQLPVEPNNPYRFGVAELQETLQMFKDHVENSSTWTMEIQMLMCRVFWNDNQPDNWQHGNGQDEDCVHVQQKWNDNNCNALYQWICKKPLSQGVA
uniref:C-type lectin domain family 4 member F n=1 Tax=Myotis myotis TaxID=51298 RepID=A0A7J7U4B3_MYOMY|nr:C-type lectin domain family 4 member F [Myotis myotis]